MYEGDVCVVCGARIPVHTLTCAAFWGRGAVHITDERQRQIQVEGWTPEHDDEHDACELSLAASAYVFHAIGQVNGLCIPEEEFDVPSMWPWNMDGWKPDNDPVRNLVKAGALIAAEIDRLLRLELAEESA